ncbi:unnamed protein product [Orchesella dallaii]|uniref:Uncharacterized protein n=1 Tax=Orchesella dallaii TaxID=48710 RepID=A0ABP1SB99_9HEXA
MQIVGIEMKGFVFHAIMLTLWKLTVFSVAVTSNPVPTKVEDMDKPTLWTGKRVHYEVTVKMPNFCMGEPAISYQTCSIGYYRNVIDPLSKACAFERNPRFLPLLYDPITFLLTTTSVASFANLGSLSYITRRRPFPEKKFVVEVEETLVDLSLDDNEYDSTSYTNNTAKQQSKKTVSQTIEVDMDEYVASIYNLEVNSTKNIDYEIGSRFSILPAVLSSIDCGKFNKCNLVNVIPKGCSLLYYDLTLLSHFSAKIDAAKSE